MLTFYKYITATLALAGCLSLLLTGELNPVFALPGLMILPGYYRYITGRPPISRWLVAGLALMEVFVLAFDVTMVTTDFLIAIAHMTIVFQALKSFDMREPWDPLQVYFMAILQMIITSELSLSILVGITFAFFIVIFMAAMVFSHFMKVGTLGKVRFYRPLALISVGTLVLAVVFFLIIPRVQGGLWGRKAATGIRTVGFSEGVDFGTFGSVLDDPTIAMRVEINGGTLPLYWRGVVHDYFDGRRWISTLNYRIHVSRDKGIYFNMPLPYREQRRPERVEQNIVIEPMDTDVIFALGQAATVRLRVGRLERNAGGAMFIRDKRNRRISYTAWSIPDFGRTVYRKHNDKYLQLPESMDDIADLSASLTVSALTDRQRALTIRNYLFDNHEYSLSPPPIPAGMTPMQWFLFESKQGYCEHYSTAMVLMLRSLGIPSRIVTGFVGGETNEFSDYVIVRQRNAHSWVEASIDGFWVRFDPTPLVAESAASTVEQWFDSVRMNWYRYVIGFSRADQNTILASLSKPMFSSPEDMPAMRLNVRPIYLMLTVITLSAAFVLMYIWRAPRLKQSSATLSYLRLRRKLIKKGARIKDSSTPAHVLSEAVRLGADDRSVSELIDLYLSLRFGKQKQTPSDSVRLQRLLNTSI